MGPAAPTDRQKLRTQNLTADGLRKNSYDITDGKRQSTLRECVRAVERDAKHPTATDANVANRDGVVCGDDGHVRIPVSTNDVNVGHRFRSRCPGEPITPIYGANVGRSHVRPVPPVWFPPPSRAEREPSPMRATIERAA